ncbi:unnamed protein product, partial [Symbiodinium necroappetens]
EEVVEVEIEAEGDTTSVIPQPATPEKAVPETPPPLPPAAALDAQEAEPMSAGVDNSEERKPARHHLPPKPKIRPQPSPSPKAAVPVAMPQQEETLPSKATVEMDALRAPAPALAPTTVRIKGSIGRQLASRARSMGLQSAVKSKAKPLRLQPKKGSVPSALAATVDEEATTTAISGTPSSGSTPHPAVPDAARTEARETAANELPAPVLVYPSLDGTLAELGPLYRREATTSDAATSTEGPAEWQVEVDGVRRPLPAMPEWIREVLAHRPAMAAPPTAASARGGDQSQKIEKYQPGPKQPCCEPFSRALTAADADIREEASSRRPPPVDTETAANLQPAVQPVESALTPTSPAEGHPSLGRAEVGLRKQPLGPRQVALLCSPMANKAHTADPAATASTGRHPGTPIGTLVSDFRRHFPRPVASAAIETPVHSSETATTHGTGNQSIAIPPVPPMIAVSPPDQSSPTTSTPSTVMVKNRKRPGQVGRPMQLSTTMTMLPALTPL